MNLIQPHYRQLCYTAKTGNNVMFLSISGGFVLPYYRVGDRVVTPYRLAPWWNEAAPDDRMLAGLRGNFLCMPMGGDPENILGRKIPTHGYCAADTWQMEDIVQKEKEVSVELKYTEPGAGEIKKNLILRGDVNVLYEQDTFSGYEGDYPVAFHPNLKLGKQTGLCSISISKPVYGLTTPEFSESPADGGYNLLKRQEIPDMTAVDTLYGYSADLSRQPLQKGIEEIVQFVSDDTKKFCYASVVNPEEGYIYFQLKNPRKLQSTMMWVSNGGRYYAPWNGRVTCWVGMEETTSYFHYGVKASRDYNVLKENGYRTVIPFVKDKPFSIELISGVTELPQGFSGVRDIVEALGGIDILGLQGEKIFVPVDLSFLL